MDDFPGCGDGVGDSIASKGGSLKSSLRGWREIIVVCSKLLKWKKAFYPAIVFGVVSLVYLMIYWLDPSVLTGLSMLIMIVCILDYVVPLAMPMVYPETNWSDDKEKQYGEACNDIVDMKSFISTSFCTIFGLKDKNPWLYVAAITVSLSTLAWLGNQMHNLLLTYFISLILLALPGMKEYGFLDAATNKIKKLMKKEKDQ